MAPQTPQPRAQALAAATPCAQGAAHPLRVRGSAAHGPVLPPRLGCPCRVGTGQRQQHQAAPTDLLAQGGKPPALPAHPSPCHHTLALSQPIPTQTQAGLSPLSPTEGGGTGRALGSPPGPPAPSPPAAPALHTAGFSDCRTGKELLLRSWMCHLEQSLGDPTHVSPPCALSGVTQWGSVHSRGPSPQTAAPPPACSPAQSSFSPHLSQQLQPRLCTESVSSPFPLSP